MLVQVALLPGPMHLLPNTWGAARGSHQCAAGKQPYAAAMLSAIQSDVAMFLQCLPARDRRACSSLQTHLLHRCFDTALKSLFCCPCVSANVLPCLLVSAVIHVACMGMGSRKTSMHVCTLHTGVRIKCFTMTKYQQRFILHGMQANSGDAGVGDPARPTQSKKAGLNSLPGFGLLHIVGNAR